MWEFLKTLWQYVLYYPFLNILIVLYGVFGGNLGLAVIVLAVILRLVMIPLSKKQTNMTVKMADLKPRLDKLQAKYKNNPEQLAKEQMKLYKEVGYNPLGCFGSFIPQLLVFMALIAVIRAVSANEFDGVLPVIADWALNGATSLPESAMHFLGLDLSKNFMSIFEAIRAGDAYWYRGVSYFVLASVVGFIQLVSIKMTSYMQAGNTKKKDTNDKKGNSKKGNADEPYDPSEMQAQMMKSMNMLFPLMTFTTALSTPAVLGLYWLVQVLMQIIVNFITHREKAAVAFNKYIEDGKILKKFIKPIEVKAKKDKQKKAKKKK